MRVYIFVLVVFISLSVDAQHMAVYKSSRSVDETVNRLVEIIKHKKLAYFETVEHDKVAKKYGIDIQPTRVILFEDPALLVRLIACRQTTALDLPMKILVWEEANDVFIGFFDPKVMKKRFMLHKCDEIITTMSRLKVRIVNEAIKKI